MALAVVRLPFDPNRLRAIIAEHAAALAAKQAELHARDLMVEKLMAQLAVLRRARFEKTIAADPAASYPRLIDAAGRCPPEDCGGIPGFYDFLEAIADPQHPDHEDRLDWYGGPFDPAGMGAAQINQELARIAARRMPTPPKDKL